MNSVQPIRTGAELRAFRKLCGYTQKQIADLLGISRRTYENWEQGRKDGANGLQIYLLPVVDFASASESVKNAAQK